MSEQHSADDWIVPQDQHAPTAASHEADDWIVPGETKAPHGEEERPGWISAGLQAGAKGLVSGVTEAAQAPTAFSERKPEEPDKSYVGRILQKPLSEGWSDPEWWIVNIAHGATSAAPALATAGLGTVAGTAAAGPAGGLVGGAAGFGIGSMAQSLAPSYQRARADGLDHDQAVTRAIEESGIAGAFGTVMGLIPGAPAVFGRDAVGALKRPISEALLHLGVAYPAVGAAQQAATGAVEGKMPTAGELATGYAQNVGVGAAMMGAYAGYRGLRGERAAAAKPSIPEGLPPVGEAVGFTWNKDEPPSRVVPKEYVDGGRSVRVLTEDGSESLITTVDLMKGLTAPPLPERPQLEGEPATLADIDKNAPPLEDMEASSTAGAQARAAGQTPERFARMQREAQANAALLPETINPLLDAADRQERYGDAALKSGNTKDAETYFSVAAMFRQRAQEAGGGPPVSERLTPEDVAAAAQARQTATQPEILGQRTPGRVEPELSPEQQAEQEMAAKLARESPSGPTETSILGQRTPLGPRSEPITPEDELRAAQMRSSTGLAAEAKRAEDLLTRKAQPQIAEPARGIQPAEGAPLEKPPETRPVPTEAPAEPPQLGELFPAAPQPTPAAPLTEAVPKQPQRLLSWLRMNGGVQDPGGDVGQIVGGYKGRPGLINRTGMTLDDAALKAWEDGYFPTDQRPSVNDLLTAIDEDHRGTQRRYSGIDSEAAADYEGALARNSEVDRLANELDIDPTGMSRTQFWDTISDRLSQNDQAREIAEMTQAHETAFAEAEARTKEWFASRGDSWEPDTFYQGVPRTLEDLERDAEQEADRRWESARQPGESAGGAEQSGPPGGTESSLQESARPGGGGAEPPASLGPERPPATAPVVVDSTNFRQQIAAAGGDMAKASDALVAKIDQILALGARVDYVIGDRRVPIVAVDRGMLADAQGQRWGLMQLTSLGSRLEIQPPAERVGPTEKIAEAGTTVRQPVTERTEQGEQIVLPGTEQSSEQAAALRAAEARTAQERELAERNRTKLRTGKPQEEPGGIFAPPPPPELFAPRGWDVAQTEPETLPGFGERLDLLDHYQAFRNGYPDTPAGAHQSARDYVVAMGNETGFEHYAAVDGATGRAISAGTSGRPNTVTFNIPDEFPIDDPATHVVVHHNHPGFGSNLSAPDVSALQYRGIKWVVAHTQDGHTFAARLTPEARAAADADEVSDLGQGLRQAYLAAESVSRPSLMMQMLANKITDADANRFQADLIMRSLDAAGIVDSVSTRGDMPLSETVRDSIIKRATPKAADTAAFYFDLPRLSADATADRINRSAVGLQPDITLARLSEGAGGLPAGAGAAEAGRGGVGEARPGEEAVVGGGTELRLAEEGQPFSAERTEPRPEGRDYVDALTEEIGRETGGRGPGTYARDMLKQGEGRTPYRFKQWAAGQDITMPPNLAAMDWRSRGKYLAERDLRDDHNARVHAFSQMLPTYLGLSGEDRAILDKAAELYRLQGVEPVFDGRQLVIENTGQNAIKTQPGERVYLDKPNLIQAAKELHDTLQKSWSDVIEGTARKFGWQGDPTSAAIRAGNPSGVNPNPKAQWELAANLIAGLESQRQAGYMTPFMRHGNYYLAVRPKNPGVDGWDGVAFPPVSAFHLVDSHTPLEKALGKTEPEAKPGIEPEDQDPKVFTSTVKAKLDELRQKYPKETHSIDTGYLFSKPDAFRDLRIPAVEKLMMLVGNDVRAEIRAKMKTSSDPEATKQVNQKVQDFYNGLVGTVLNSMYKEMQAGFKKRANATPGYDPDFQKSLGSYLNWNASHVADLTHRDAIDRADQLLETHPDPAVTKYWANQDQLYASPYTALDAGLSKMRKFTFLYLLGMNAATTAKIALHGPTLGINVLGTGLGAKGRAEAAGAYFKAFGRILKTASVDTVNGLTVDLAKSADTPEKQAMLQRFDEIGITHPHGADELGAMRQSGEEALTPQANFSRRVVQIWASNVRMIDRATRGAMAIAAHDLASNPQYRDQMVKSWGNNELFRALGENPAPADVARFMVDRATGVWGPHGRPPIMNTRTWGMLGQFKTYEMLYLSNMLNLMTRMGPEGKVSAALMLGSMGMLAGAMGLPFVGDATKGADFIYKSITDMAPDIEDSLRKAMDSMLPGRDVGETVLHGMRPFGVDLGSISFGDIISKNLQSPLDFAGAALSTIVGKPYRAYERYHDGQGISEAARELVPNAVKNIMGGFDPSYVPTSAATGKPLLSPDQLTTADRFKMGLGFEPEVTALTREHGRTEAHTEATMRNALSAVENRITNMKARGDEEGVLDEFEHALKVIEEGTKEGVFKNEMKGFSRGLIQKMMQRAHPEIGSKAAQRMRAIEKATQAQP